MAEDLYTRVTCPTCGHPFWTLKTFADTRSRDGAAVYCPAGHQMSLKTGDSKEVAALKKEVALLLGSTSALRRQLRKSNDTIRLLESTKRPKNSNRKPSNATSAKARK